MENKKRVWLAALRKEKEMTQSQVAKEAGISQSCYGGIESGSRNGKLPTLVKIARVLGFNVERFYDEDEKNEQ